MAALGYVGSRINVGGVDPNRAPPMVHDWAPGIQHSLGRSTVIEADYFGTAGRHIYIQTDSSRFRKAEFGGCGIEVSVATAFAG